VIVWVAAAEKLLILAAALGELPAFPLWFSTAPCQPADRPRPHPASPFRLQDLASLRQQQGKDEEALALLRQSLALWFKPAEDSEEEEEEAEEGTAAGGDKAAAAAAEQQAAADKAAAKAELGAAAEASDDDSEEGSEGGEEMDEDYIEDELPSYEFRFETAKLLLELDDSVDTATQVGVGWVFPVAFLWAERVGGRAGWHAGRPLCCSWHAVWLHVD
jgi:hypothetical protein